MHDPLVIEPQRRSRFRFASQVHAEACTVVALRALAGTIGDDESPAAIRERILRTVAIKTAAMGIAPDDIAPTMDRNFDAICRADALLNRIIEANKP